MKPQHLRSVSVLRLGWLRSLGLPFAAYLGVTLVVPALNGALGSAAFLHHATCVLRTSAALALAAFGILVVVPALWRRPLPKG